MGRYFVVKSHHVECTGISTTHYSGLQKVCKNCNGTLICLYISVQMNTRLCEGCSEGPVAIHRVNARKGAVLCVCTHEHLCKCVRTDVWRWKEKIGYGKLCKAMTSNGDSRHTSPSAQERKKNKAWKKGWLVLLEWFGRHHASSACALCVCWCVLTLSTVVLEYLPLSPSLNKHVRHTT